jgi:uncharacterized protein YjcR
MAYMNDKALTRILQAREAVEAADARAMRIRSEAREDFYAVVRDWFEGPRVKHEVDEMAEALGVSTVTITRWAKGTSTGNRRSKKTAPDTGRETS